MATRLARRAVKSMAAGVWYHSGLRHVMRLVRRAQSGGHRIQIVSYHRVVSDYTGALQRSIPGLLISKETFTRQIEEAHAAGFEIAPLSLAVDVITGRKVARHDLFVVTFDDGYRDVYRNAFPIMKRMGIPATLYLPTDYVGTDRRFDHDRLFHLLTTIRARHLRPDFQTLPSSARRQLEPIFTSRVMPSVALDELIAHAPAAVLAKTISALEAALGGGAALLPEQGDVVNWDEVREMADAGLELGAHTRSHRVLTFESPEAAEAEIVDSKRKIEQETQRPVRDFAYCNGWYSDALVKILARNGFRSAVTTEDLLNRIGGDPFALKRKVLWEGFSTGLSGDYSAPLTACAIEDVFGMLRVNHPVIGKRSQQALSGPPEP